MLMTDVIRAKRDGRALSPEQIRFFLSGYVEGAIPDYQAAALLMAIVWRGLEPAELDVWVDQMIHSGDVMDLSDVAGERVDKHSTGGVGDKTSLILAPLVAECGLVVPMMAGRGLGHTGGTLDKLEAIPGFHVEIGTRRFRELLDRQGCAIIGQSEHIAPADRKLYALRDVTATVESHPLIASSIMSKKIAAGVDALVLDVKTGSGAFLPTPDEARVVARLMIDIGQRAGKRVRALITDMGQPLGNAVGNSNEVRECVDVMKGGGPADLVDLTLELAIEMLQLGGVAGSRDELRDTLRGHLTSGAALRRFATMVEAQGGDTTFIDRPEALPWCDERVPIVAPADAFIADFDCRSVGQACVVLGGGRARKEDTVDPSVGLDVVARRGARVAAGDPWCWVHAPAGPRRDQAVAMLEASIRFDEQAPAPVPLVFERVEAP